MKLHITVGRDGLLENRSLVSNRSSALYCSPRAQQEIFRQMSELGTICTRCGMIARSDELDGNRLCIEGTGCTSDVDLLQFYQPESAEGYIISQQVPHSIWRAFIETVTHIEWLNSLPKSDNERNDVKW